MAKNSDFLSKALTIEAFIKKYKMPLIILVLIIIAIAVSIPIYSHFKAKELAQNYENFKVLENSANINQDNAQELKKNAPNLYALLIISKYQDDPKKMREIADLAGVDGFLKDFATYQMASLDQKPNDINSDFSELAKLQAAYLLAQKGDVVAMRQILEQIPHNSRLKELATLLSHYGAIKNK
ncbi:MAG: hypothetical protein E7K04_04895 [Helicobacter sp.]|nr:hypothetical protein [Helicobacter sp.]